MGCCHSSPDANSSQAAAADQQQQQPARALDGASSNPIANNNARPNHPIRPPSPVSKTPRNVSRHNPPWTRSIYEDEVRIYFETKHGGDKTTWATVKAVCENLRNGDIEGAQTILDAANLSVPNGRIPRTRSQTVRGVDGQRVRGGVYDVTGRLYDVPSWACSVPRDLIDDPPEKDMASDEDEEPSSRPSSRPEKGKGRAQSPGLDQRVRIRYNDLPRDATFIIGSKQTIATLRQKILEERGIQKVRLVLIGHLLEDHKVLEEVGWNQTMVINAFVSTQPSMDDR